MDGGCIDGWMVDVLMDGWWMIDVVMDDGCIDGWMVDVLMDG